MPLSPYSCLHKNPGLQVTPTSRTLNCTQLGMALTRQSQAPDISPWVPRKSQPSAKSPSSCGFGVLLSPRNPNVPWGHCCSPAAPPSHHAASPPPLNCLLLPSSPSTLHPPPQHLWISSHQQDHPYLSLLLSSTSAGGLPWWFNWSRICLQYRRPWFNSWVGKIPWRREQLPTPVFWPGESMDYTVQGVTESRKWRSNVHFHFLSPVLGHWRLPLLAYCHSLQLCSCLNSWQLHHPFW